MSVNLEDELKKANKEILTLTNTVNGLEKHIDNCLRSVGAIIKSNKTIEEDNKNMNKSFAEFVTSYKELKESFQKIKETATEQPKGAVGAVNKEGVISILDAYFEESEIDKQIRAMVYTNMDNYYKRVNVSSNNKIAPKNKFKSLIFFFVGIFIIIASLGFGYKIYSIKKDYKIILVKDTKILNLDDKKEYALGSDLNVENAKRVESSGKIYYEFKYKDSLYRIAQDKVEK